ncbi:MAG: hypothetical protein A2902_06000 [Elusimicrobia bacterium RIFCSPLOWO2_01_FULL_64_13]|nr:MAG: hypothetical protein A2636_07300 [Elusimicrobia bacterium RIFCSPHIGHO2_01_FULL_64_10]OGR95283.1 MAG: hypothetical protein A2902_06000 [Elusimicrobia bacterium RIFCSPLOWO2_01_FULL_64_13]
MSISAKLILLAGSAFLLSALAAAGDDPASVERGRKLYLKYSCGACHGPEGRGGIKNPNAIGGEVPPLARVREGYTLAELKEKIEDGFPAVLQEDPDGPEPPLFMPAWKKVLSKKQIDGLARYLMSLLPENEMEDWE